MNTPQATAAANITTPIGGGTHVIRPEPPKLESPATLLIGDTGTGKTHSLVTYIEAGVELFVLITEPRGIDTLLKACQEKNLSTSKLHWAYVPPATESWGPMSDLVKRVNTSSYEDLAKIKIGLGKDKCQQLYEILHNFQDFKDAHTGQSFGDVTTWGPDRCLAIDSLSGLSLITWQNTVGLKPTAAPGEWGVAMNVIEQLILKLSSDVQCHFVVTAHAERETDELTGANKTMAGTLGKKLAPKLGRFFSEVVMAKRTRDGQFVWDTQDPTAALKSRFLGYSSTLDPSFVPLVKAHKSRMEALAHGPK